VSAKIIFEREVHVTVGEDETLGVLRITCTNDEDFAVCSCAIPGIDEKDRPSYGMDELHALCLAIEYAKGRILSAKKNGIVIWWVDQNDLGGFAQSEKR